MRKRFGVLLWFAAFAQLIFVAQARAQSPTPVAVSAPAQLVNADATPRPTPTPTPSVTPTPEIKNSTSDTSGKAGKFFVSAEKREPVRIPRFETPPVIDGKLDDEVWRHAAVFRNFVQIQPGDNIAPSEPTEVLMGYDSKNLYIAFRAIDDPSKVRSTVAKRDQIFDDDNVGVFLDTFNDQRRAYELFLIRSACRLMRSTPKRRTATRKISALTS